MFQTDYYEQQVSFFIKEQLSFDNHLHFSLRQKKYREKIASNPENLAKYKEKCRDQERARYRQNKNNPEFLKNRQERQKTRRWKKNNKVPEVIQQVLPGSFKSKSTYNKALKKYIASLPKDQENQKALVQSLYFQYFPERMPKYQRKRISNEVDVIVENFYERNDVSQQLPGKRDVKRILQADGTVQELQKRVMLR